MTGLDYQKLAMRTASKLDKMDALRHGLLMLASEAGECCGLLQKTYQGHMLSENEMTKELGDVLWAVARVCDAINLNLDHVMEANIDKLRKRYPDGFETARSVNREEYHG